MLIEAERSLKKMQKEYKDQNIEQMINTRSFLKKFKNKVKKK